MADYTAPAPMPVGGQQPQQSMVPRDEHVVDPARAELVTELCSKVTEAKEHWEKKFKKMRADQRYAHGKQAVNDEGGKEADGLDHGPYVANLTLRRINQRVGAIYAKNPRAAAKRRPRMDFTVWDGTRESLVMAQQTIQAVQMAKQAAMAAAQTGVAPVPMPVPGQAQLIEAAQLLQDVKRGHAHRKMLERLGKTLEIIFHYSLDEPTPRFKPQAKQLVRRALTTGLGYVKLGYQRILEHRPETQARIKDVTDQLARIERMTADLADGEINPESATAEQLKIELQNLQSEKQIIVREGLMFDFPKPWQVIIDPDVQQIKGFVGATWVAHEFLMTPNKIQEIYGVDVGKNYKGYTPLGLRGDKRKKTDQNACVWEFYDLEGRVCYVLCDGYCDFLKEPGKPSVDLEQFHPFFTLSFNDVEDDEDPYPPSDVELTMPMANEYNRSREGLRQHRIANRPAWTSVKGTFGEDDKDKLAEHASHEMLELNIPSGKSIDDVLRAKPVNEVDVALYDTEHLFTDILRVSGDSEPTFGGTSGATATETTIAEQSRATGLQSNIDDLDEVFTEIARAAGQILLSEMSPATAKEIAGEGAVWPELDRATIAKEIYLEIKAGSSGRPNRAMNVANIEKLAPYVVQTPDLNPKWWLEKLITEIDDTIDLQDVYLAGTPSITAMNAMAKPATGNPESDPSAQGPQGARNAPAPAGSQSGGSQQFPAQRPGQQQGRPV